MNYVRMISHQVLSLLWLNTGYIPKLTLTVKDEYNAVVRSNQPMPFVLEVRDSHTSSMAEGGFDPNDVIVLR